MISSELRDKVIQFINSSITLQELEEWLVPRLPQFLESPTATDADVVAAIELGLAEINDGIRTVDEFRDSLKDILQEYPVVTHLRAS